jgi:hypothetical protein
VSDMINLSSDAVAHLLAYTFALDEYESAVHERDAKNVLQRAAKEWVQVIKAASLMARAAIGDVDHIEFMMKCVEEVEL